MTADDPYGLGPWVECASCHRRYRPAQQSGQCYDCAHNILSTPEENR